MNRNDEYFKEDTKDLKKLRQQNELITNKLNELINNHKGMLNNIRSMHTEQNKVMKDIRVQHQRLLKSFPSGAFDKETIKIKRQINVLSAKVSNMHINHLKLTVKVNKAVEDERTERKRTETSIKLIRNKLLNFGLEEAASSELRDIALNDTNIYLRRRAALELSLFYTEKRTVEYAQKALEMLSIAEIGEMDLSSLRTVSILKAECYKIIGSTEAAKSTIDVMLKHGYDDDLMLAAVNYESDKDEKLKRINQVYEYHGVAPIDIDYVEGKTLFECIYCKINKIVDYEDMPLVTVIMPVYNAEETIETAVKSVLNQSWTRLEVIIVDDCSTDSTLYIIKRFEGMDSRVKVIQAKRNGGPYCARNLALTEATGEFVTCHEADDWSHPQKIEIQVVNLINNIALIANTSETVRISKDLDMYRRKGNYVYKMENTFSLMFRRKAMQERLGYWDNARFGGDEELYIRLRKVFGRSAIAELMTAPLELMLASESSLTGNKAFGIDGFVMGAGKEYFESYKYYIGFTDNIKYSLSVENRLFPIPQPVLVDRSIETDVRNYDVIVASDFRLHGGSNKSNIEEIKCQRMLGLKTGLVQMYIYDINHQIVSSDIRELIDGDFVNMLVYGEKISCDLLILRYASILQNKQLYLPDIEAKQVIVVVNQTPMSEYGEGGVTRYSIPQCENNLLEMFSKHSDCWYPISPMVRENLSNYHSDELRTIKLSEDYWYNIINTDEWKRNSRPQRKDKIIIGRHSRDNYLKWPCDIKQLYEIYPTDSKYEVRILGGLNSIKNTVLENKIPMNWLVDEFDAVNVKDFLSELDVFIYFTHPDWVESFGRVIIEAMAVGVPVILPKLYKETFGDAAIYAEPYEVRFYVDRLMEDDKYYDEQVRKAFKYAEDNLSYRTYKDRLRKYISRCFGSN